MIEVDGIDMYYGPVLAFRSVSLTVGEGEKVALLGANGAGKTRPCARCRVCCRRSRGRSASTGRRSVAGPRRKESSKEFDRRFDHVMTSCPSLTSGNQAAGTMSGGEQQMLAMARALMCEPRVLLVDERSMGLAPLIVTQLFDAMEAVNREVLESPELVEAYLG